MLERAASAALFDCKDINIKILTTMKKISVRLFFTVLWRGLRQALRWFFELFGYKGDGKFAKCVWRLFATSIAVILAVFAVVLVTSIGETIYDKYYKEAHCYDPDCNYSEYISKNVYFHNLDDGKGYVFNSLTGEKTVRHIHWIAKPEGEDSLICFSNGTKRGYFNKNTGDVVVEPKYSHAWVFSEGLASVDDNGTIKFIDGTGNVIIDKNMPYIPDMDGYMFHGGYCVIGTENGNCYGLMDKTGNMVLEQEYSSIIRNTDESLWCISKGTEMGVLDKNLNPIVPLMECSVYIDEGTIDVTLPDHTMRKYDMQGKLINDFYISNVRTLEYEKDEILYRRALSEEIDGEGDVKQLTEVEPYRPRATARLRAYVAGGEYEGLMTSDGHIVMMPLYKDIEAIGHDLYLCTSTNYDKVIVNGKGEIVK